MSASLLGIYRCAMCTGKMKIIIICVITLTILWSVLAILVTKYNINNFYINKLKSLDFFAMNHYHHLGIPIKKIKTILGGSVTLLFLTSVISSIMLSIDTRPTKIHHHTKFQPKRQSNLGDIVITVNFLPDSILACMVYLPSTNK